MDKKQAIAIIDKAFAAIHAPQDGFMTVRDRLYRMELESEREHRKHRGRTRAGISVNFAARLFTVQHLAEAIQNPNRFTVDDITSIRTECLFGQAYANRHKDELSAAWDNAGLSLADILAPDYVELMQ